jgi:hypothetical protein
MNTDIISILLNSKIHRRRSAPASNAKRAQGSVPGSATYGCFSFFAARSPAAIASFSHM